MLKKEESKLKLSSFKTIPVKMSYQAGYAQFRDWSSGKNFHRGIGYFEPFGISEYYCGADFEEAKDFSNSDYLGQYWLKNFEIDHFCVYRMKDGDIYAYDGVIGAMLEGTEDLKPEDPSLKKDALINVIVGGTGVYEGAKGFMLGHTEGSGDIKLAGGWLPLPEALWKVMEGYINLPKK